MELAVQLLQVGRNVKNYFGHARAIKDLDLSIEKFSARATDTTVGTFEHRFVELMDLGHQAHIELVNSGWHPSQEQLERFRSASLYVEKRDKTYERAFRTCAHQSPVIRLERIGA